MNRKTHLGFTLIELMLVVAIIAILATIGLPQLSDYLKNNRLTTQVNALVATLNFARGEAITRNTNVFVTALNAGNTDNEWGSGWEIWVDGRTDGGCDANVLDGKKTVTDDCDEVLRVLDYSVQAKNSGFPQIDVEQTLATTSMASLYVEEPLAAKTLVFRGDGTLALVASANNSQLDFRVCDDRTGERGRHLVAGRLGRVRLENSDYICP